MNRCTIRPCARSKADWLIGINATRLFSVLYHKTLNVGRVQTPTLAMLAERDGKIMLFQKKKYYHVRLSLNGLEAVSDRVDEKEKAVSMQTACQNGRPFVFPWNGRKRR